MRIRLVFNLKNKGQVVPFFHQPLIKQLTEEMLGSGADPGMGASTTFSTLKGQSKVAKAGLMYFSNRVTIVYASKSRDLLQTLSEGFMSRPVWRLGNLELAPDHAVFERMPALSKSIRYVCLSPLVLTQPQAHSPEAKRFIVPGGMEFKSAFYRAVQSDIEQDVYQLPILFEPDMGYIAKLQEEAKKFARIYSLVDARGELIEIRGYTFPFVLTAPDFVHQTLLNEGLGFARSQGFGMLDIADGHFNERLEAVPVAVAVREKVAAH